MSECQLRKANGQPAVDCEEERCTFWRLVEQAGVEADPQWSGCAIQHFELLDGGSGVAAWLLSVKERLEGTSLQAPMADLAGEVIDPRD